MSGITPIFSNDLSISFSEEFKDKVRILHEHFDHDNDGFLNFKEIRSLQYETSGEDMDENNYIMICRALDCHPKKGISIDALRLTYASDGANIDDDYKAVFSQNKKQKDAKKSDVTNISMPTNENKKNDEDDDVIEMGEDGFDVS